MERFDPATSFTGPIAEYYDKDPSSTRGDEAVAVECLAGLAGDGPALELAIGTGRIGLPLAARGYVAVRARPHGPPRRPPAAPSLGWLETGALRLGQSVARLGLRALTPPAGNTASSHQPVTTSVAVAESNFWPARTGAGSNWTLFVLPLPICPSAPPPQAYTRWVVLSV